MEHMTDSSMYGNNHNADNTSTASTSRPASHGAAPSRAAGHDRLPRSAAGRGDGLSSFARWLHPEIVKEIRSWADHDQLAPLHDSLVAHTNPRTFLDAYSEAMVACHLLRQEAPFRFEVETPNGKHCDFELAVDGQRCYLHLKRLTGNGHRHHRQSTLSSRLRYLEGIQRPFDVKVRWPQHLSEPQMQQFVQSASEAIQRGHVGDEFIIRDESGRELGGVLIQAPWEGEHVRLSVGIAEGFADEAPRIGKLMKRAARQFMPGAVNVVLVCGEDASRQHDFEDALLGSHIERWDRHPPQGRRIAHGRAADGFWHEARYKDCQAAGWFLFNPASDELRCSLYVREHADMSPDLAARLNELFETADE